MSKETVQTFQELFKEDHSTPEYIEKYCNKLNISCKEVGITLSQGMHFLEALYRNK